MRLLEKRALFWDADPADIDLDRNKAWVIARVLNFGDLDDCRELFRLYPEEDIRRALHSRRDITPKTRRLWELYFGERS